MKFKLGIIAKLVIMISILFLVMNCSSKTVKEARDLINLKLYDQAIELLTTEINKTPKKEELYFELGNAYWNRALNNEKRDENQIMNDINECIQSYEDAIKIKPEYIAPLYNLGVLMIGIQRDKDGTPSRAISYLEKVINIEPNHLGANTYLGYIYDSELKFNPFVIDFSDSDKKPTKDKKTYKSFRFLEKSLKLKSISDDWIKIRSVLERDNFQTGTFIVMADSVPIYSVNNNDKTGILGKYSIKQFYDKKDNKYYFDIITWENRIGWSLTKPNNWNDYSKKRNWYKSYGYGGSRVMDFDGGPFVFKKLPPNSKESYTWAYDAYLIWIQSQKIEYDILTKAEKNTAKLTGLKEVRTKGLGTNMSNVTWYGVSFNKKIYNKTWINDEFVIAGTGSIYDDENKILQIKERTYWQNDVRQNILNSLISKGLTRNMFVASLGNVDEVKKYPSGDDIIEIWTNDDTEFTFINGRLFNWKEKGDIQ